jgi:hypothetical protein
MQEVEEKPMAMRPGEVLLMNSSAVRRSQAATSKGGPERDQNGFLFYPQPKTRWGRPRTFVIFTTILAFLRRDSLYPGRLIRLVS